MNRIASVFRMHAKDKWSWFLIPWIVLMSSFLINLLMSFIIDDPIYTGGIASIYIYMLVAGIVTLAQTFPFALGLSVTRRDYFMGTVSIIAVSCAVTSIGLCVLSFIESDLIPGWGTELYFFHLPYWSDGSILVQMANYFFVLLHLVFLGFVISSLYRRFGRSGLLIWSLVMLLIVTVTSFVMTYFGLWMGLFQWVATHTMLHISSILLVGAIVYVLLSYLLLRRATVQ
jgi:hypothetical protein